MFCVFCILRTDYPALGKWDEARIQSDLLNSWMATWREVLYQYERLIDYTV